MNHDVTILSLGRGLPPRRYSQREIYDTLAARWQTYRSPRVQEIFMSGGIESRYLAIDLEKFDGMETLGEMHERFAAASRAMSGRAVRSALYLAGVVPAEIGFLAVSTCTGYLCPGLSALCALDTGLPVHLQRCDLVGMGCSGALPAIQRASDFVKANPGSKALAVAVEVCSACYYLDDTLETIIGNAICADGAVALVLGAGPAAALPRIAGFHTLMETSHIDKVGFQNREGRLRIVLSKELRDSAGGLVRRLACELLARHGLSMSDVDHWVIHPGGRKIIDAVRAELDLDPSRLRHSCSVLRNFGNVSSPTVLFVLQEFVSDPDESARPKPGDIGVMIAMGPGLSIEGALLRW